METSITNPSGGTAAQTNSSNPNKQMQDKVDTIQSGEEHETLKKAAAKFDCAWTSLKNNIKSGKLAATQANEKAPYMVRLADVEAFLRATPGIVSIFHPAGAKAAATETAYSPTVNKADDELADTATISATQPVAASAAHANQPVGAAASREGQACQNQETVVAPLDSPEAQTGSSKRRRRRRRGKGNAVKPSAASSIQPPALKALAGTTPQERLRITACLTELLGLVASA